ncbi:hypothetical protein [Parafannyhessea sp. LCP21S3_E6]|uniref:hypothetical protein n=1 Tax=unclassified Parafannyhessea TaxID=2847323 RepID=UPI003F9813AA
MAKPHDHTDTQSAEGGAPKDEGLEYPGAVPVAADELDVITGKDLDRQRAKSRKGKGAGATGADSENPLKGGFGAIRQVRAAAKRRAEAHDKVKSLKAELEESQKVLDHRTKIEADYEKIVATQNDALMVQGQASARAQAVMDQQSAEKAELEGRLAQMKTEHEEQLRPYRELMESTKGRADDAAKTLADAKRQAKAADQQLGEATKRREQSVASANRSVDNSQERLRKAEGELDALKADSNASPAVVQKKQSDIVAERAHLDAARADLDRVTNECKQLVDGAQANLAAQRRALESAETAADAAKREADEHREEYERLYNAALAGEKELSDEIAKRDRAITTAGKERQDADARQAEAKKLLDEATEIHATPEVSAELARTIAQGRKELEERMKSAQKLAHEEKHLREATRKQRFLFIGAIVLAVVLVALVATFVMRTL